MNGIIPGKQNRANKKHAGGMPKFEPTDEQRQTVERAAGFGLPQDKICQLVVSDRTGGPIDDDTLRKAFRAELDRGMAVTHYKVANSLVDNALAGNVTAQIWFTKRKWVGRKRRWSSARKVALMLCPTTKSSKSLQIGPISSASRLM